MKNNFEKLATELKNKNEKIILDIGCGNAKRGNIGLDFFDGPSVDIVTDLNHKLPIPDKSCDEIKMFHVLEHVKDPLEMLKEVKRTLKDSGLVEIRVPHYTNVTAFQIHHRSYWNSFSLDPLLSDSRKSNEGFKMFSLVEKKINLYYFKFLAPIVTKNKYFYEMYLSKIFPAYEIVFVLKN